MQILEPRRLLPNSFDPNDPLLDAIPVPPGWKWNSCETFLRLWRTHVVIHQLPLFWQTVLPLRDACASTGTTLYPNEPGNYPIGAAVVTSAAADAILIEADDAAGFADFLIEHDLPFPAAWFIIHRPDGAWQVPLPVAARSLVAQEVHLSPGAPILVQCEHLAARKEAAFHRARDGFHGQPSSLPLHEAGACICGEPILARV